MKLENQLCTLEQSTKLKELGITQKSIFYHHSNFTRPVFGEEWTTVTGKKYKKTQVCNDKYGSFSAFSIAELGQMLPSETGTQRTGSEDSQYSNWEWASEVNQIGMGLFATEVEARADMLIHFLEHKLEDVESCNERLIA